jgi:plasmid stabilization system protein ParE
MNYEYLSEAEVELDETTDYYDRRQEGLGMEFYGEVIDAVGQIIDHPEMWPKVSRRTRRCLVDRFPYSVIYHYNKPQQHIAIVAIAHNSRKPGYWKNRL